MMFRQYISTDRKTVGTFAAARSTLHRLHRRLRLLTRIFLLVILAGLVGQLLFALAFELNPIELAISLAGIAGGFVSGLYTAGRIRETLDQWHRGDVFARQKAVARAA